MFVSLVCLLLEVDDDYPVPSSLFYKAPDYKMPVGGGSEEGGHKGHISFAAALSTGIKRDKEILDKTRGCRNVSEISIETFYNEGSEEMQPKSKSSLADCNDLKKSGSSTPNPDASKSSTACETDSTSTARLAVKWVHAGSNNNNHSEQQQPSQQSQPAPGSCRSRETSVSTRDSRESSYSSSGDSMSYANTGRSTRPKSHCNSSNIHFFSGNPMVEVTKGILHVYKDNQMVSLKEELPRSELICMLGVSAAYTIHDLLRFTAPVSAGVESMRIIRDSTPNQYMVLIKFKTQEMADEFYMAFNNTHFNSIESDVCHLVYVAKIEAIKSSEGAGLPIPGLTELPNCPVCLERMDESVEGILTILCNHAFHVSCLAQWGYTSCPVCRYCQTPEQIADNRCLECNSQESLWICLICGHVGCGRYVGRHAYRHFQETQHTYAMQLGNNKVWDYAGDNYVHRLVQNKADGKLVEVDERGNAIQDEKLDALTLEYTYLLTSQLESQRLYFEERIARVEKETLEQVTAGESRHKQMVDEHNRMEERLEQMTRQKVQAEKKCSQYHGQLTKVMRDLQEERAINKSLLENQSVWQRQITELENRVKETNEQKDKELEELREQLRDMMFHLGAQQKLAEHDSLAVSQKELQEGQVIVGTASASEGTTAGAGSNSTLSNSANSRRSRQRKR